MEPDPNVKSVKVETKDNPQITIEVDGEKKTLGAEDVQNLIAQQASATQKTQKVAALLTAAEKYGLEPEEFVSRAQGAFATVVGLMDDGVLDEEGKRIKASTEVLTEKKVVDPKNVEGKDSKELEVVKGTLEDMAKRQKSLEDDNLNLMRENLSRKVRKKHPELNKEDVSRLFGIAAANQNKDVWQHAEEFVGKKKEGDAEVRAVYAKEFGIKDLKVWDENKVKEQDAKGGGAASILGGRKISFKKGKDTVTPRQAMSEFIAKQNQ